MENIIRYVNQNYVDQKNATPYQKGLYELLSYKIGKYSYNIDGYFIVRYTPTKQIGTKNWYKEGNKLTPYYELYINQEEQIKFWHLKDCIDYIKSIKA